MKTMWLAVGALGIAAAALGLLPSCERAVPSAGTSADDGPIWFEVTGKGDSPEHGVWQVQPDGTGARKVLDFSGPSYWHIAWSPDGARIAFQDSRLDHRGISSASPDGSNLRRLTDGANDDWPSWSPDGTMIAFSGSAAGTDGCEAGADTLCPTDISVMRGDGTDVRRLTDDPAPEYQPAWSPDGTRIAFVRAVDVSSNEYALEVMDADGTNVRQLTADLSPSHPSWSPDGRRIAFAGYVGTAGGVYVMNDDGSDQRLVAPERGSFTEGPAWSPDGSRIAFVSDRGGVRVAACGNDDLCPPQIYLVNPDGSGLERITAIPEGLTGVAWRPIPG
jgi:Tol biopolymer transport system component